MTEVHAPRRDRGDSGIAPRCAQGAPSDSAALVADSRGMTASHRAHPEVGSPVHAGAPVGPIRPTLRSGDSLNSSRRQAAAMLRAGESATLARAPPSVRRSGERSPTTAAGHSGPAQAARAARSCSDLDRRQPHVSPHVSPISVANSMHHMIPRPGGGTDAVRCENGVSPPRRRRGRGDEPQR
jgi:hypothetical protein